MNNPELGSAEATAQVGLRHKMLIRHPGAPILYLVHGRVGNLDLMWLFKRTFPEQVNIISVEAPLPDQEGPLKGFSWWQVGTTRATEGAPQAYTEYLSPALEKIEAYYALTPPRRVGIGFSQGGALLSVGMQLDPARFHGVGMLASFLVKVEPLPQSEGPRPHVLITHGVHDAVVPLARAEQGAAYLRSQGYPVTMVTDEVEHKLGSEGVRALGQWLRERLSERE